MIEFRGQEFMEDHKTCFSYLVGSNQDPELPQYQKECHSDAKRKMAAQVASHPFRCIPSSISLTDQGMGSKTTSRILIMDIQCPAPVAWCMAKPNTANSIDESLPCGGRRIQL